MACAHRPSGPCPTALIAEKPGQQPQHYELLAGDMHCHVSPPDRPPHVTRGIEETVALAHDENLDFVVLTPHVRAPFFMSPSRREQVLSSLTRLEQDLAKQSTGKTTFIVGFEYTDFGYGHVGAAFADLRQVLDAVPAEEAIANPGRFFEEYVARGGVLTINHPLLTPLDSFFSRAQADLSWRPFTAPGPYPDEIVAADRLAQGVEAFNLAIFELRDRFLLFDTHSTLRATLALLDHEIVERGRRMTPVGGSDTHSGHLRATTFVWSKGRDPAAIREGILAGRVCVRDPAACSFAVRAESGPWLSVGSSVSGVSALKARANGVSIEIFVNGKVITPESAGQEVDIPLDAGRCTVLRARVDEGYSAPIYANCPF